MKPVNSGTGVLVLSLPEVGKRVPCQHAKSARIGWHQWVEDDFHGEVGNFVSSRIGRHISLIVKQSKGGNSSRRHASSYGLRIAPQG